MVVQDKPEVLAGAICADPEGLFRTGKDGWFSFTTGLPGVISIKVGGFECAPIYRRLQA